MKSVDLSAPLRFPSTTGQVDDAQRHEHPRSCPNSAALNTSAGSALIIWPADFRAAALGNLIGQVPRCPFVAEAATSFARWNLHMPMGRFGRAEEAAGTVAYLASDDAGYVTASGFPLDGGITAAYTIPT